MNAIYEEFYLIKRQKKNPDREIEPLVKLKMDALSSILETKLLNNDDFREEDGLYSAKSIIIVSEDKNGFLEKDKFNNLVIERIAYQASRSSDILPINDSLLKSQFINEIKKIISAFIEQTSVDLD